MPVHAHLSLEELRPHLHSLPEHPDWIPYRTSYYQRDWGFCLRHRDLEALRPGDYEVLVDATLAPGELVYGEVVLPGSTDEEVLISAHVCHPSLANDNLSGLAVATELVRLLGRPAGAAPHLPLRLRARHIGSLDLAEPQRATGCPASGTASSSPASAVGPLVYKRRSAATGEVDARRRTSSRPRRRGARLLALGLRRAPVQRRRLRPARGAADPHPARRVPGVPHLGRRPRLRRGRRARRRAAPR